MIEILKIFAYTFVEMLRVVPVLSGVVDNLENYFTLEGIIKQWLKIWAMQHVNVILPTISIVSIILGLGFVVQKILRKKKFNTKGDYYGYN